MDHAKRIIAVFVIFSSIMLFLIISLSTVENILQGLELNEVVYYPTTLKEFYAFLALLGYSTITALIPGIWILGKSKLPYQVMRSSISVSIGCTASIAYLMYITDTDLSHINEINFYVVVFLTLLISSVISFTWWEKPNKFSKRDAVKPRPF